MERRIPFALDSREKKLLGVCAGLGRTLNVDPLFVRLAFVAVPLLTFVSVWQAIVAYLVIGIFGAAARHRRARRTDYERMGDSGGRTSVHDLRTKLDASDRRMMAIDHHLHNSDSDALAREIEALRKEDRKEEAK